MSARTIIIGGGLAGLSAALELQSRDEPYLLLERGNSWGGKLQTIRHGDYALDLGFQVLLSGYPAIQRWLKLLDPGTLRPCFFDAGALLLKDGKSYPLSDPWRHPSDFWGTLSNPLITFGDKLRVLGLLIRLWGYELGDVLTKPEWQHESTLNYLSQSGFSDEFIRHFVRPFFGGVFGGADLDTKAGVFIFCFLAFARGRTFIPAGGIGLFPDLMAQKIRHKKSNTEVMTIISPPSQEGLEVHTKDGIIYTAERVIIATSIEQACQFFDLVPPTQIRQEYTCLYFRSEVSLYKESKLFLNANPDSSISFGAQLSNIGLECPGHLIMVTCLSVGPRLAEECQDELERLFPHSQNQLHFLKSFELQGEAGLLKADLVSQNKLKEAIDQISSRLPSGVVLAGEYLGGFSNQELTISQGQKITIDN